MQDFVAIYARVRSIPRGRVMSYGQVGAEVGASARTVGWALHSCPENVPWQRVVGWDGRLPIAKRDPHLHALQKTLLQSEGVTVNESGYVERRFFVGEEAQP